MGDCFTNAGKRWHGSRPDWWQWEYWEMPKVRGYFEGRVHSLSCWTSSETWKRGITADILMSLFFFSLTTWSLTFNQLRLLKFGGGIDILFLMWWICDDCKQPDENVRYVVGYMGLEYSQGCKIGTHQHRWCSELWMWMKSPRMCR